jgi:ribose transport system substrate-binding protein
VVILNGPPVTSVIDRVTGCKKALATFPKIKLLSDNQNAQGSRDGGLEVMANLLTADPQIDGVFSINDPTGVGAELAIKQAHRTDVKVITAVDGSPDAESALKDSGGLFDATAAQNPYKMASLAVQDGYDIFEGKKLAKRVTLLAVPLVTRDNIGTYVGWVRK